ncbi:MAG: hypothetical protein JW806_02975 [Sedimentisphaerales bacterium]|nr:hypothetical protein [Sedimentisphaerales bacterium]
MGKVVNKKSEKKVKKSKKNKKKALQQDIKSLYVSFGRLFFLNTPIFIYFLRMIGQGI